MLCDSLRDPVTRWSVDLVAGGTRRILESTAPCSIGGCTLSLSITAGTRAATTAANGPWFERLVRFTRVILRQRKKATTKVRHRIGGREEGAVLRFVE